MADEPQEIQNSDPNGTEAAPPAVAAEATNEIVAENLDTLAAAVTPTDAPAIAGSTENAAPEAVSAGGSNEATMEDVLLETTEIAEEEEVVVDEFDEDDFDDEFDDDFEEEIVGEYDLEDDKYGEEFTREFGHLEQDDA